ncbi:MAG: Flp pilus assembly pilin Flp [Rickettsiales bacterium]|jgi:Flp pilus assembly pilin Flp
MFQIPQNSLYAMLVVIIALLVVATAIRLSLKLKNPQKDYNRA